MLLAQIWRWTLWVYDCDFGQGLVVASSYEEARAKAIKEAGTLASVCNVRQATKEDIAFREAMGGLTE